MSNVRTRALTSDGKSFVSAKTQSAIPVTSPLLHELMVQATLDPSVQRIGFMENAEVRGRIVTLNALIFVIRGERRLIEFPQTRSRLRTIDDEGLALIAVEKLGLTPLTITSADIRVQPRAENSRLVWACRHGKIGASDRVRILQTLADDGETSLGRLAEQCRYCPDPVSAVLALVCMDLVEADLTASPLGPDTRLRRRLHNGDGT